MKIKLLSLAKHMVKLIKNCFAKLGQLIDENGSVINFHYIIRIVLSKYSLEVVTYIAGFVVSKFGTKSSVKFVYLNYVEIRIFLNSLISLKSTGKLKYPIYNLIDGYMKAEKV